MRQYIEEAHAIRQESTSRYLELTKAMKSEISKINANEKYSGQGKAYMIELAKKDFQEDLLKLAKEVKSQYQTKVAVAKSEAEKLLSKPRQKPDDKTIEKYSREMNELKTKVMLSLKPESAQKLVSEFAGNINDPFIAEQFRNEFASVITPIIGNATGEIKMALGKVYDNLDGGFLTDEQREARGVIETADAMFDANIFNPTVLDSVQGTFGKGFVPYVNNPDAYKPEDTQE